MIKNQDRSKWFGASDTSMLFANPDTPTFRAWWGTKLGAVKNNYSNIYMTTGNALEHKIIDALDLFFAGIQKGRHPYYRAKYRLRVNIDGKWNKSVVEVKTTSKVIKKITPSHWRQCQAEMFGLRYKTSRIVYYRLLEEDYENYFNVVDLGRIKIFKIDRDEEWIQTEYLPRLRYVAKCLRNRTYPYKLNEGV